MIRGVCILQEETKMNFDPSLFPGVQTLDLLSSVIALEDESPKLAALKVMKGHGKWRQWGVRSGGSEVWEVKAVRCGKGWNLKVCIYLLLL